MKKKIGISILIIIGLFMITGCGTSNKKKEEILKQEFTEEVYYENNHVKFKVPKDSASGFFKDLGHSCQISYYTNQTSVMALYPYDDEVEKVDKVTINGYTYDTYKYVENLGTTYVYRTKVNKDYHLFQYFVASQDYDDTQPEAFMNTVEFVYDSIESKYE